jgi:hypothetical protein
MSNQIVSIKQWKEQSQMIKYIPSNNTISMLISNPKIQTYTLYTQYKRYI